MSFIKEFPIDIGTFVIINYENVDLNKSRNLLGRLGTIACYQCVDDEDDDFIVIVSGYKDSWCGEYLLSEIMIANDKQIEGYKKEMGIG